MYDEAGISAYKTAVKEGAAVPEPVHIITVNHPVSRLVIISTTLPVLTLGAHELVQISLSDGIKCLKFTLQQVYFTAILSHVAQYVTKRVYRTRRNFCARNL